jgi:parallel beta-helix repeat protein
MRSRMNSWNEMLTKLGFKRKKRKNLARAGFARPLRVEGLEDRRMLATITVTALTDGPLGPLDGFVSLREAIHAANNDVSVDGSTAGSGADTIVFSSAITGDNQKITLTEGELHINTDLTIDGPSKGQSNANLYDLTISGNHSSRIFNVFGAVEISGLILTEGSAGMGGAIYADGASLTIDDVEVSGNQASESGGGLFIRMAGSLTATHNVVIRNSTISGNTTTSGTGGGIGLSIIGFYDSALIEDSTISDNTAFEPELFGGDAAGGGINVVNNGYFTLSRSTVSNNTAYGSGGGLHIRNFWEATIENTTISGNRSLIEGGGAHVRDLYDGSTRITHSTIVFNEVGFMELPYGDLVTAWVTGGGLWVVAGPDDTSPTVLSHTIVTDNEDLRDADPDPLDADKPTPDIFIHGGAGPNGEPVTPQFIQADYSLIGDVKCGSNTIDSRYPDGIINGFAIGDGVIVGASASGAVEEELADNGGPTWTHALLPGSAARNAGDPSFSPPPAVDQRGFGRVAENRIDIGAFEYGSGDEHECDPDFDDDGDVDGRDFLIWQRGYGTPDAENSDGDADDDGDVDGDDLECWQENYGQSITVTGNFNGDSVVNEVDLAILVGNFGMTSGATLADGDADGDGDVDDADFISWQVDYAAELGNDDWIDNALNFDPDDLVNGQIIVTNPGDENDGNYSLGDLSLREALALSALAGGSDVIVFANHALGTGTLALIGGQLTITSNVEIIGPGADQFSIDAQGNSRVFNVMGSSTQATLRGLTITGGNSISSGETWGGGIITYGILTVDQCQILANHATYGGGVFSGRGGVINVTNSTLSNNTATYGGAISISTPPYGTFHKVSNSTISGNTASQGGGIHGLNPVNISNSTITLNSASSLAGGVLANGNTKLFNSIVAGNSAQNTATRDISGVFHSTSAYNLVGYDSSLTNNINHGVNGNQVGGQNGGPAIDPQLGNLANNGGSTPTHALDPTSPAIDLGDPGFVPGTWIYDQRGPGFARVVDGDGNSNARVDIGAFEYVPPSPLFDFSDLTSLVLSSTHEEERPEDQVFAQLLFQDDESEEIQAVGQSFTPTGNDSDMPNSGSRRTRIAAGRAESDILDELFAAIGES